MTTTPTHVVSSTPPPAAAGGGGGEETTTAAAAATTADHHPKQTQSDMLAPFDNNNNNNNADNDGYGTDDLTTTTMTMMTSEEFLYDDDFERDEVVEIQKGSATQTSRVHFWRLVVALGLIVTGVAVTATSYQALLAQETTNFENAYAQFSRTVGQAAIEEILRLREAARSFANEIQATAQLTNTSWPFYDFYDGIGTFAKEQVDSKGMESISYLLRVTHDQRSAYREFQRRHYQNWIRDGHLAAYGNLDVLLEDLFFDDIIGLNLSDGSIGASPPLDEYWPQAFRYPPPNSYFIVSFDIKSINYDDMFASLLELKNQTLISNVNPYIDLDEAEAAYHQKFHDRLPNTDSQTSFPHSFLFHPVKDTSTSTHEIVAVITFPIAWDASLRRLLPDNVEGIVVVARNNCNQSVTYEIVGPDAYFLGWEDLHDPRYDRHEYVVDLDFSNHPNFHEISAGHCTYALSIYPSTRFQEAYQSTTPLLYVTLVGCTFAVMIVVFFVFDRVVQHRNNKLIEEAARSNELVTSMFPGALRDKVMSQKMAKGSSNKTWNLKSKQLASMLSSSNNNNTNQHHHQQQPSHNNNNHNHNATTTTKVQLRDLTLDEDAEPLAELHPETTISFADIVGFTRWSSCREPSQVFKLLETIYRAFDVLARQRKIFKVETVGDCYVAVAGFPDKQEDHAARMCRFCALCLKSFSKVVSALEESLGPDTGELDLRVGIHSGQVTAGVLRGDRTRFQLFGDAMNTTARVETTGSGGKIHMSEATAQLLQKDGFGNWIVRREDKVFAKGLGYIQTYFLRSSSDSDGHKRVSTATVGKMAEAARDSSNAGANSPPEQPVGSAPQHKSSSEDTALVGEESHPDSPGSTENHILDKGQKTFRPEEAQATA